MPAKQLAVVTGGGTGIGRAISQRLAQAGYGVAVVYSRSREGAEETVANIQAAGGEAFAIQADVADERQVQAMLEHIKARGGALKYLVNNAGITRQLPFEDLAQIDDAIWDELLAVNLKGSFYCCRALAPELRRVAGSAILNIGSIAGETGYGSSLPYAVSKAAVHGLTRSLARALAPAIRVNCLAPGAVETRWWHGLEDKMRRLSGALPLQRISTPGDIAETAYLLLSAESVTGQILRAENGQTL